MNFLMSGSGVKLVAGGAAGFASREVLYALGKKGKAAWRIAAAGEKKAGQYLPTRLNNGVTTAFEWLGSGITQVLGDLTKLSPSSAG